MCSRLLGSHFPNFTDCNTVVTFRQFQVINLFLLKINKMNISLLKVLCKAQIKNKIEFLLHIKEFAPLKSLSKKGGDVLIMYTLPYSNTAVQFNLLRMRENW